MKLWLDTISSIKNPDGGGVTAAFKNGSERHLVWHGEGDIRKFKKIEFLKPARRGGQGSAMFDDWKYSPLTGEELRRG